MPFLDLPGRRIHVWAGKADRREGCETVLFIHGAGGNQLLWAGQKAFFEKRLVPIMADLPGHGASAGPAEESLEGYAEVVNALIDRMDLRDLFLVGHSMGGAIVQLLALTRPGRLKGIVLVATAARLKVLPAVLEGLRTDYAAAVRRIVRTAYGKAVPAELVEQGAQQLLRCPPEVFRRDLLACDRFDARDRVGGISVPCQIVCGDEDGLTPLAHVRDLHERIPGSRLEIIPGAGHMVMIEAADRFNEVVAAFVEEHRTSPGT
jgi:pimeloyl-ACP methyl ester carboxylesterase